MFDLKPDGLTKSRQGYLFTYAQIAFNQFRRFANLQHFHDDPQGWRKFTIDFEREAELLECRILAVLSTALFLEAYIYDYGARRESGSYVEKYLDKLDPVAKWVVIPRLAAPPGLERGDNIFERLRKLFKLRNDLVHHKTKEAENFTSPPKFPNDLQPNNCITLICDILTNLREVDPSDEFADFVLRHIQSWFKYCSKDSRFYPILWEA